MRADPMRLDYGRGKRATNSDKRFRPRPESEGDHDALVLGGGVLPPRSVTAIAPMSTEGGQ